MWLDGSAQGGKFLRARSFSQGPGPSCRREGEYVPEHSDFELFVKNVVDLIWLCRHRRKTTYPARVGGSGEISKRCSKRDKTSDLRPSTGFIRA